MYISRALPAILLWLQAVTAAPAPLERRQASVLKGAISKVTATLQGLDTAILSLDASNLNTAAPLLGAVEGAQKSLTEASASIKGAKSVGLLEAIGMLQPANDLTAQVQKTLGDLTAKKPVFDQLGVSPVVADALKQQKVAANELTDAMFSKLPAIAQTLAGGTADTLNKAVDDAIKAFEAPPAAPAPKPAPPAPATPATPAPVPKPAPNPAPPAAPASPSIHSTPNTAPKVPGSVPLSPKPAARAF
ncbi:hypothetical protein RB595_008315 [Gaeumannomyces hyphopodioides]